MQRLERKYNKHLYNLMQPNAAQLQPHKENSQFQHKLNFKKNNYILLYKASQYTHLV